MKAQAIVRLSFPSEKYSKIVVRALGPETKTTPARRSSVRIEEKGRILILNFEAKDTTALRASINSYLRWIVLVNEARSILESL